MLSERSGLGLLELAVLRAVEVSSPPSGRRTRSSIVLERVEVAQGYAAAYVYPVMADLLAPWQVHLRLLDQHGNWGSPDDSPAEAKYTEVRLSELGALVQAAERGDVGPVPVGLIDGSAYRGGSVPPLAPAATLEVLRVLVAGGTLEGVDLRSLIGVPTGGVFLDGLDDLVAGRPSRVACSCRIVREVAADHVDLVIVGTPLGVGEESMESGLTGRMFHGPRQRPSSYLSEEQNREIDERATRSPLRNVRCEHSDSGARVVVQLVPGADVDAAEELVRATWPVTVHRDWQIPGGLAALLRTWADRCRADPSGLDALVALVAAQET